MNRAQIASTVSHLSDTTRKRQRDNWLAGFLVGTGIGFTFAMIFAAMLR